MRVGATGQAFDVGDQPRRQSVREDESLAGGNLPRHRVFQHEGTTRIIELVALQPIGAGVGGKPTAFLHEDAVTKSILGLPRRRTGGVLDKEWTHRESALGESTDRTRCGITALPPFGTSKVTRALRRYWKKREGGRRLIRAVRRTDRRGSTRGCGRASLIETVGGRRCEKRSRGRSGREPEFHGVDDKGPKGGIVVEVPKGYALVKIKLGSRSTSAPSRSHSSRGDHDPGAERRGAELSGRNVATGNRSSGESAS